MNQQKPYFTNLDVLRFVAAFAVFVFHLGRDINAYFANYAVYPAFKYILKITDRGALGVNFFFVLSGFLITNLMLWEFKAKNTFSYKNFLVRRTLRIWPLYFLIVLIGFFILPKFWTGYHTQHSASWYALFLANFDEIRVGAFDSINFLTSPWSIAVEEQFYVVWGLLGLLFLGFMRRSKVFLKYAIYALLCVSLIFRWVYWQDERILYYHTLSVMPDLLFGCLMAIYWEKNPAFFARLKDVSLTKIRLFYALGISIILLKNVIFFDGLIVFERYVIALFFCFVIMDQIINERKMGWTWFQKSATYLGKISYGIYMFHLLVMFLLQGFILPDYDYKEYPKNLFWLHAVYYTAISIFTTIIVSHLSYKYFERPFLKLKSKF